MILKQKEQEKETINLLSLEGFFFFSPWAMPMAQRSSRARDQSCAIVVSMPDP